MTMQECILMKLLDCGIDDLSLLENINYDLDEILDNLLKNCDLNINNLFREIFRTGAMELREEFELQKKDIEEDIKEELEETKRKYIDAGYTKEQYENETDYKEIVTDLDLLHNGELNPEEDLDYFYNCLDTYVFMKHIEFYRRWMESEVEDIEYEMGWKFEKCE